MSAKYFSGQGRVLIAEVVNGVCGAFSNLGNVPMLKFDLKTKTMEHQESTSGQRLTDFRLDQGSTATITADLEEFVASNLARVLRSKPVVIPASTVTGEILPDGLVAGDLVRLQNAKVTAVIVKDSAGAAVTAVEGVNYSIDSAAHGTLAILDVGTLVQPLRVDYAYGAAVSLPMFNTTRKTYFIRFEGLNTADSDAPVLVEFYRFMMDPSGLDLISDNMNKFTINGTVLFDASKPKDGELGQFGRVVQIG